MFQCHTFQECARRFPVPLYGNCSPSKQDKFILTVSPDQLKCVVTLTGDSITHAVSFRNNFHNCHFNFIFLRILILKRKIDNRILFAIRLFRTRIHGSYSKCKMQRTICSKRFFISMMLIKIINLGQYFFALHYYVVMEICVILKEFR